MNLSVDPDLCCGAGVCAALAPAVFGIDDDGYVVLEQPSPSGADAERADDAVRECPSGAISKH